MWIALLIPTVLSSLLLAAHFLRHGILILVVASLLLPCFLFIHRVWAVRLVQVALVIGMLEWIRTLVTTAIQRLEDGASWKRMAVILGIVALWTLGSALLLETPTIRRRYRRSTSLGADIK